MTRDYSITLEDATGKTCTISINGACIDDLIKGGYSESEAVESVEQNAGDNAIACGKIAADCWIVSINR